MQAKEKSEASTDELYSLSDWYKISVRSGSWAGVTLVNTPQNDIGFHSFWNRINQIFGGTINLL
jgi:hypothetical protein